MTPTQRQAITKAVQTWQGDHDVVMKTTAYRALIKLIGSLLLAEQADQYLRATLYRLSQQPNAGVER